MTRALLGTGLTLVVLCPLGVGVLLLTGLWTRFGAVLRLGLAVFVGIAAALVVLPPLLYAGLSPSLAVTVLLGALVFLAGAVVDSRRIRRRRAASIRLETWPSVVLSAPIVLLALVAVDKPVSRYDAFSNWGLKAKLLAHGATFTGALADRWFATASIAPPVSRQFPIGLPALEAVLLDGNGTNLRAAHLLFVCFLAGLAVTSWALLRPYVAAWPLTAGISFLLWMPAARDQALYAYADVPLACVFAVAAVLIGLWLAGEGVGHLALGSLFAAAALATKRDAIAFCAVLYAVALVACLWRRDRRGVGLLAASGVAVALTTVPWQVFVSVHDLENRDVNFSVSRALGRGDAIPFVLRRLGDLLLQSTYLGAVLLAALAALLMLARGRDRPLAVGVLALGIGLGAALVYVYLSGVAGVHYLVRTSAYRTVMTPTILAAAILPLLVTRAFGADRPQPPGRPSG
jgi:hypothetical protein